MSGDHQLGADSAALAEIRTSLGKLFGIQSQEFERLHALSQHVAPPTLLSKHAALMAVLTHLSITLMDPALRESLAQILRRTSLGRSMQLFNPEAS